jgi:hydroxymethylglutaryl-CoA lyase
VSDLPGFVHIQEEGPREGFQMEKGPISTDQKVRLIDALSHTGLKEIKVVSFVNPKLVPGMADAEEVVARMHRRDGVRYTALCLNAKGIERAVATGALNLRGVIIGSASDMFLQRNQRIDSVRNLDVQRQMIALFKSQGIPIERIAVMAAFGCNFQGDIAPRSVLTVIQELRDLAGEAGVKPDSVELADTMAWATPLTIKRLIGAVRERFPELRIVMHLHDTRGMAIANAYAAIEMGVDMFDASVAGLGGCPFAAHAGAAGNVCTEDLVFMLQEMGIETGVDLERLIEAARLAETVVGHPLPGSLMRGGSLRALRAA